MNDLAQELEEDTDIAPTKSKQQKKKTQLQQRLAAERKKEVKQSGKKQDAAEDDEDEGDALMTFANKGVRKSKNN
jgi:hypothetical protein